MVPGWIYSDRFERVKFYEESSYSGDPNGCSNNIEESADGAFAEDSTTKKYIDEYNLLVGYLIKRGYSFKTIEQKSITSSEDGKNYKLHLIYKRGISGVKRYSVVILYTTEHYLANFAIINVCRLR
jgi:hypothetical protein